MTIVHDGVRDTLNVLDVDIGVRSILRRVFHSTRDRGEERVRHVGEDQRDRVGPFGAQASGYRVGHVSDLGDGLFDPRSNLPAHRTRVIHDTGYGDGGDPSSVRDIDDRWHQSAPGGVGAVPHRVVTLAW